MDIRESALADYSKRKGYRAKVREYITSYFPTDRSERLKLLALTASFFFIIGAYTIAKELKDIVFSEVVGKNYIGLAKLLSMIFLVPAIFLYSKLVDKVNRYQLLSIYSGAFGVMGLIFSVLLGHGAIGLSNTNTDPYRLFGWFFYFFIEAYTPFLVSVFWAFANSINTPESAKNNYAVMVSGSKLGGMFMAAFAWFLLSIKDTTSVFHFSDIIRHQILLGVSSALLLVVPVVIYAMVKFVSSKHLHGYEAVYKAEKQREKSGENDTGVFSGLSMLFKYPYAFGMFAIVLFYEIIQTILNFQRLGIAKEGAETLSDFSASLFVMIFFVHFIGFIISVIGTKVLLEKLGEKRCLLLVPISTALLFTYFRMVDTQFAFFIFLIGIRSIHYAFSYPVRESLYILTVKEIKFKSKSWIDAFGAKFAKFSGSIFNSVTGSFDAALFLMAQSALFSVIIAGWVVVAYMLGTRFERALARNEVIGLDPQENQQA